MAGARDAHPLRPARRWAPQESGPTATVSQRARRRQRLAGAARALVYAPRSPAGELSAALEGAGLEVEWSDSGAGAVGEAVDGNPAVCIIVVGSGGDEALDYLPCLNQANPALPVIVLSESDSLELQRRLRSHRLFFYLVGSPARGELGAVLAAALASRSSTGRGMLNP